MKVDKLPIVPINIKKLCQERDFYTINIQITEDSQKFEKINYDIELFEKLDSEIAPIIQNIIANRELRSLTSDELDKLIIYTAYQYFRVDSVRKIGNQFWDNEEDIRLAHAGILKEPGLVNRVANILSNYQLDIINPILGDEFVISDSPVLWDTTGEGIYFPLNPNICLYYHDEKYGLDNCLNSICINDLLFRASVKHTIARSEQVLSKIKNNVYQKNIAQFCQFGKPSYWKCVLETNDRNKCLAQFEDQMEDFKHL